jgi:hypothetical protein
MFFTDLHSFSPWLSHHGIRLTAMGAARSTKAKTARFPVKRWVMWSR